MKPFNLEAAKAGKPLVTRDGRKVTEFHHFETCKLKYSCVAIVGGESLSYTTAGFFDEDTSDRVLDLFLADEEVTVWVNVYEGSEAHGLMSGNFYENKEDAENVGRGLGYIGAFPLTVKI
jgi:hypothetical protein